MLQQMMNPLQIVQNANVVSTHNHYGQLVPALLALAPSHVPVIGRMHFGESMLHNPLMGSSTEDLVSTATKLDTSQFCDGLRGYLSMTNRGTKPDLKQFPSFFLTTFRDRLRVT